MIVWVWVSALSLSLTLEARTSSRGKLSWQGAVLYLPQAAVELVPWSANCVIPVLNNWHNSFDTVPRQIGPLTGALFSASGGLIAANAGGLFGAIMSPQLCPKRTSLIVSSLGKLPNLLLQSGRVSPPPLP